MDQPSAPSASTLGSFLKQARERAQLSLSDLSEITCVPRNTIHRLERDEVLHPSIFVLLALVNALELKTLDVLALLGVDQAAQLPDLATYLQIKYPQVPEAARTEAQRRLEEILHKHEHSNKNAP
ncbi:helix-turn-helix domain-containing protein [Amycolatopsis sp. NBC_01480]|uniref:helix-turn-helix domain-containing protein n=1 Tax=Amycolatopsis sp. NBC_01480 TaxID=2903562 RepID=UPI003FA48B84